MNIQSIGFLIFLFIIFSAKAADAPSPTPIPSENTSLESTEDKDCQRGSGPEMAGCLLKQFESVEKELNGLISEMKATLVDAKAELAAQKAWKLYREKECRSQQSVTGFGAAMQYYSCSKRFTQNRIEELRTYHYCDENGCPARR